MKKFISLLLIGALVIFAPLSLAHAGIISATGGTITTVGSDKVHVFTSSGTFTPTGSGNVKVLVVAGGGGGCSGGGGGGGVVYNAAKAVSDGVGLTVTIGAGGAGKATNPDGHGVADNGQNSVFGDITANGGGGGGDNHGAGANGGCGGGAGSTNGTTHSGGTGSQGYNGGASYNAAPFPAGGGGGGAAVGADGAGSQGGVGGAGYASAILDDFTHYYAGGGGGTSWDSGTAGAGGNGGGGDGQRTTTGGAGTANTGGGGGGSADSQTGGAGGSGIVLIRYTPVPAAPTNVSATDGTYTDKVTVTWTKSTGATNYKVYEGSNLLATLGDVATYDDTAAGAPTITPGTASASDGTSSDYVSLSLSGASTSNGASRTYKVVATNAGGDSPDSATDTGYRGVGSLAYQWQRSAADSDASYSDIGGATTASYDDTGAPASGAGRYYKCVENATGASQQISTADRGYRQPTGYQIIMIN